MQQYLLTSDNAKRLLQGGAGSAVTISLDLNLSTADPAHHLQPVS